MKEVLLVILILASVFTAGVITGRKLQRDELPSCLYLNRPRGNDIKPWGCDGKEGIDWYCSEISGGGTYVSLHQWK